MYQSKKIKVLCIYSGINRNEILKMNQMGIAPDAGLIGLNKNDNILTNFLELNNKSFFSKTLNLRGVLSLFKNDFIISSVGFPLLFVKSLIPFKTCNWVVLNIDLTNSIRKSVGIKKFFKFYTIKKADAIICISKSQINYLKNIGVKEEKLKFIPFGGDMNFYKPSYEKDENSNREYILSVGRDRGRDYNSLIKIADKLNKKIKIVASRINLEHLKEIPKNVEIFYDIDYIKLRELYKGAEVVVVPSKNEKNYTGSDCSGQTVILDAMACGKPVVATYRSWMADYFKNNEDIVFANPEDPEDLLKKISNLLIEKEKALRIGENARKSIETEYNMDKFSEKIKDILEIKK